MLSQSEVFDIAKEEASKLVFRPYSGRDIPQVSIGKYGGDVIDFLEKVRFTHKELLTSNEESLRWEMRMPLRSLMSRLQVAFSECDEIEFLGPTLFGADVKYDAKENELIVIFYSYAAGNKIIKERVTKENQVVVARPKVPNPMDKAAEAFFNNGGEEVVQTVMEACGARLV